MKITIRNDRIQPVPFTITDRPIEVKTSSLSAAPDTVPPSSTLSFHLQEGDVIVLQREGGITIEKGENNG
jgi:hypothetical protein